MPGMIIAGQLGGILSEGQQHQTALLICGLLTFATLVLIYFWVPEQRTPRPKSEASAGAERTRGRLSLPALLTAALFVTLWNFNPFNTTVLYLYATEEIGPERNLLWHDRVADVGRCDDRQPGLRHLLSSGLVPSVDPYVHRHGNSRHARVLGLGRRTLGGRDQRGGRLHLHDREPGAIRHGGAGLSASSGRHHVRP